MSIHRISFSFYSPRLIVRLEPHRSTFHLRGAIRREGFGPECELTKK